MLAILPDTEVVVSFLEDFIREGREFRRRWGVEVVSVGELEQRRRARVCHDDHQQGHEASERA